MAWDGQPEPQSGGRYRWEPSLQRLVKVSERASYGLDHVGHVPSGGYFSENLGVEVTSRRQKKELMARRGIREVETGEGSPGPTETERSRERRQALAEALERSPWG